MTAGGVFIVLEGGEGSGKSTQAARLATRLHDDGRPVLLTHEPGGTNYGTALRVLLLDQEGVLDSRAELLLMLADRAQHVSEVMQPALEGGAVVVCDRFTPSSLAYQGVARGVGLDLVAQMSAWAAHDLEPDVVVVLDVPDEVARARRPDDRDRFERAGHEFHRAVRGAYRNLADRFGWVVVDGVGTADDVHDRVWAAVAPLL